jgi:hypothetical protein
MAHIGDIHDETDVVTGFFQGPAEDIIKNERPQVPDMGIIVNRGAAAVYPGFTGLGRLKKFQFPGFRIIELQIHGFSPFLI